MGSSGAISVAGSSGTTSTGGDSGISGAVSGASSLISSTAPAETVIVSFLVSASENSPRVIPSDSPFVTVPPVPTAVSLADSK